MNTIVFFACVLVLLATFGITVYLYTAKPHTDTFETRLHMHPKRSRWLKFFKYTLPLGITGGLIDFISFISLFYRYTYTDITLLPILLIALLFFAVHISLCIYLYIGLCEFKKSVYLITKNWFFILSALGFVESLVVYMNLGDVDVLLTQIFAIILSKAIIGIFHTSYIENRKELFI